MASATTYLRLPAKTTTDKLQRVLNAAARVVSNTRKFDRGLSQLLHDNLHWLDVPDRVAFKLIVTVHRCLNGRAPNYLLNHVIPVSAIVSRQRLRSAQENTLVVPRYRLTTYGRRAFSVAGHTAWNSLPVTLRDPTISDACFRRHLKTVLFAQQRRHHSSACETLYDNALYKFTLHYTTFHYNVTWSICVAFSY